MRQAIIFTLLSSTLISSAAAVAEKRVARQPPYDWVVIDGDHNNMSGSMDMVKRAKDQQENGERLLYVTVRGSGKSWVIRDPATLDRVKAVWLPVNELGEKMGELGDQMGKLGNKQSKLGEKMGELGEKMGRLGMEMAGLPPSDPRREKIQEEMEGLQRDMEPLQGAMQKLNEAMQPLQEEMSVHSRNMEKLSAKAQEDLARVVDAALAQGLGKPPR